MEIDQALEVLRLGGFPEKFLRWVLPADDELSALVNVVPDQVRRQVIQKAVDFGQWLGNDREPEDGKLGLLLYGPSDGGKTTLAVALALLVRHHLSRVRVPFSERGRTKFTFVDFLDLLEMTKEGWAPEARDLGWEAGRIWARVRNETALLVLDDLGTEHMKGSSWAAERTYWLVNTFYAGMIPLVVTTNCSPEELASRLLRVDGGKLWSDRIMTRLRKHCAMVEVKNFRS